LGPRSRCLEGARLRRVTILTAAVTLAATGVVAAPTRAAEKPRRLGAAVGPVRLVPTSRDPTAVDGLHRFFGTVEIDPQAGGLVVSNRLSLERYLLGLDEVPLDWPDEALRAQAVAARTYALHTLSIPRLGDAAAFGFDICATTDCQVFSGADVVGSSDGRRWKQAVRDTANVVLTYGGQPILARYHSTSGGRTLGNAEGFPGEPDYPYLRAVASPNERAAPLWRWKVVFSIGEMQALVESAGWWNSSLGRLKSAHTVPSKRGYYYPDVVLIGRRGRARRTADDLQNAAIDIAPALFPGRYPSVHPKYGPLPVTLPSNRFEVETRGKRVLVDGRGFGHGVGMSQYGAFGLARKGATHQEILTHYYSGAGLQTIPEPQRIEVGVATGLPAATATGAFKIIDGRGRTLVRNALGSWGFSFAGPGVVSLNPPAGHGLPLEVGIVRAPRVVGIGEPVFLTIALSRPARVRTLTTAAPGGFEDPGSSIKNAGRRQVVWLAPVEAGTYRVRVEATAGAAGRRSQPVEIEVRDVAPDEDEDSVEAQPEQAKDESPPESPTPILIALAIALVAGAAVYAALGPLAGRIKR
jgi:SpoIID/LytB domain protein